MKKLFTFHILLLVFFGFSALSQDVENLKKELLVAKIDTIKLSLLSDLHWANTYTNKVEARKYANQELALALSGTHKKWQAQAYNDLGITEQLDLKFRKAIILHQKALQIRTEIGDEAGMGSSLLKIGMLYCQIQELDKALEAELKALIYLRKVLNKQGIAYALNNVCAILEDQKIFQDIKKYATESYTICYEIGDSVGMANAANYIGQCFERERKLPEADQKFKESLAIFTGRSDTINMSNVLNNLGYLYTRTNKKLTLQYYEASLALLLAYSIPDTNGLIGILANVANQHNILKDFAKATSGTRRALFLSQKGNVNEYLSQIYSQLSDIYTQTGQADSAIKYAAAFQNEVERKFSDEMASNFSKLQTQFEIDLREQQKATLLKENEVKAQKLIRYQILIVSLLVVVGLLILVFWLFKNRQKIIQKRKLDEERWLQQELKSKAVIEAEERERQRIARELHDGVGQQLSAARLHLSALEGKFESSQIKEEMLLTNAISMMDDAVKEVRSVAHAMLANALLKQGLAGAVRDFIQKINNGGLIKIELEISGLDQKLDPIVESMLFRIIQEIMSNIIRHSGANQVTIQLHRQETELVLMVEDNGIGFDPTVVSGNAGLQNMRSRVAYINGTFELDSSPERGTTISVEVKI